MPPRGTSSIPQVWALLATLVASKPGGRFAETGAAFGKGALAIAGAMDDDSTFVTVELDDERYSQAVTALAGTRAEVLHGRWQDFLPQRAPYDLLFADGGIEPGDDLPVSLLKLGGIFVKDDMTPGRAIEGDSVREWLLRNPLLVSTEIMTTPTTAAIIAVRR